MQWIQFGLSLLYVMTVLSMVSYVNGELLGVLLYDSLPSVVAVVLARRAARGGVWVARGLVAVQCWLLWLSFVSLLHMDYRGLTQTAVPVATLVLLRSAEARDWFALPAEQREEPRAFRVERMILWRRDRGQTAMEYLGLVLVVAAIIGGLVATGIGQELTQKIGAQVCRIGGGGDCGGGGGADAEANDPSKTGDAGGSTGTGGGTGSTGGGTGGGTGGTGGQSGDTSDVVVVSGDDTARPVAPGPLEREVDNDDFKEDPDEPLIPDERHDRSWWDHTRGFFVAPFTGLVNDTYALITNPKKVVTDSWNGLKGYTTDWWKKKGGSVSEKWKKGDKLGAAWEGTKKGLGFAKDLGIDMFVDKENWKKGNYGAAGGNTILGLVGILSPKTFKKFTKLGKIKKPHFPDTPAGRAAEAAENARKAAEKGDLDAAAKHADEAQKAADEAAEKARKSQKKACKNIALPRARVPFASFSHAGTGTAAAAVYHGGRSPVVALQAGSPTCGPDDDDVKASREAQQKALDARADVVRKIIQDHKNKQITEKSERFQLDEKGLDRLLKLAKDEPDLARGEIGKKELADSLEDLGTALRTKNIDSQSRGALGGPVVRASNRHALAEAMAEVRAAQRIAEHEAAPGTKVYAGIGDRKGARNSVDLGDGTTADMSGVPEADAVYKGLDGKVHTVEVKNTGNAARKASVHEQIKRLGDWQKAGDGRQARYEIATDKGWEKIFDGFEKDKSGTAPSGTPAGRMAEQGVGARIGGQDVSPTQLQRMNDAWSRLSESERRQAVSEGRMSNPRAAMGFLGVQ
ncbi:Flp family type IVb pilin [Streptomyces sp. NPDC002666]